MNANCRVASWPILATKVSQIFPCSWTLPFASLIKFVSFPSRKTCNELFLLLLYFSRGWLFLRTPNHQWTHKLSKIVYPKCRRPERPQVNFFYEWLTSFVVLNVRCNFTIVGVNSSLKIVQAIYGFPTEGLESHVKGSSISNYILKSEKIFAFFSGVNVTDLSAFVCDSKEYASWINQQTNNDLRYMI